MPSKKRPAKAKVAKAKVAKAKVAKAKTAKSPSPAGASQPMATDISMHDAFAAVFKKMQAGMKADLRD
jgi:hypothetical protein